MRQHRLTRIAIGACAAVAALGLGATAAHAAVTVAVSDASGDPGAKLPVTVSVTYDFSTSDATQNIVATQNTLTFDPAKVSLAKANKKPDCAVNGDLFNTKAASSFGFLPSNCDPTLGQCTSVNAAVFATDNNDPILATEPPTSAGPVTAIMYTCQVTILAGATGTTDLTLGGTIGAGYNVAETKSVEVCGPSSTPCTLDNGTITVTGAVTETPTAEVPTVTPTSAPATETPTQSAATVTATKAPATATATKAPATATATKGPATRTPTTGGGTGTAGLDDDGCQINTHGDSGSAWMLLIPAVVLAVRRRRR